MKTYNVIQNHSDHTLLAISNSKNKNSYLHYKLKILLFGCKSFRLLKLNILGGRRSFYQCQTSGFKIKVR